MPFNGSQESYQKNSYYHQCIQSLRLVFRDPCDQGLERKMETPSSAALEQNMLLFVEQWNGEAAEQFRILTPDAMKEIRCLLVNI